MAYPKRAPSIDMANIELRNVSPAPTYTSTFHSKDVPISPLQASFAATPKSGISNNPYFQTPATKQPASSISQPKGRTPLKDEEDVEVKPDYQDPNHPHFAGSTGSAFPTTLPARSRRPRKLVWIPGAIIFLIILWFTSIYAGVRFFDVLRPVRTTPTVQEISVYINGESFQGSVSVSVSTATTTATATKTSNTVSTKTIISQIPSSTVFAPGSNPDVPPDTGDRLGAIHKSQQKRLEPVSTGFMTVTKSIPWGRL
jgi:hypothetical protein